MCIYCIPTIVTQMSIIGTSTSVPAVVHRYIIIYKTVQLGK